MMKAKNMFVAKDVQAKVPHSLDGDIMRCDKNTP